MAMKSETNEIKQRKQFIRQVVTTAMLVGYVLYTYIQEYETLKYISI